MLYDIKRDCKYIRYYDGDTVGHCFGQKNAPKCDFELCTDRKCGFKCSGNYTIEESNTDQEIVDNKEFMSKVNINISNFKFGEWVSVEDRLPTDKLNYIVYYKHVYCDDDGYYAIGVSFYDGKEFQINLAYKVTHWMPLPQPPKGE